MYYSLVLSVLYILYMLLPQFLCECEFPEFLQSTGDEPSWFVTYQNNKEVSIKVKQSKMYLRECKMKGYRTCQNFERKCAVSYGGNRYLVREYMTDLNSVEKDNPYRCIQFLYHSRSVIQVRISRFYSENTSETLCNDAHLMLDQYPMVSREHAVNVNECPAIGGYDFKLFRYGEKVPLCDDIFLPLRIESDCTWHEGIKLYFRRRNCSTIFVGRQVETEPVELQCVASWQYMHYTFAMVKWRGSTDFWCIRVTYKDNKIDEMYVYFSGICPSDYKQYERMLILRHFKTHYVTGICADQNMKCSYQHCSTYVRDNCKLSCALCEPEMEERPCSLPTPYHGYWNSLQDPTTSTLVIENQTLTQGSIKWECVESQTKSSFRNRRVMKLKFDDGCYPRYKCIEVENPTNSILRIKTGKELFWPIDSIEEVCEDRYFTYEPQVIETTGIARTSGPWVYFVKNSPEYTNCNLPWYIPKAAFFEMYDNKNRLSNQGCLINGNDGPGHLLHLYYTYENMNKQWSIYERKPYYCIASIKFIGENDVLITKNAVEKTYMCWTFMQDSYRNYVYIFSAKDCGNGTNKQLIYYSAQKALVWLVLSRNSTNCDFISNKSTTNDDALSNLTENNMGSSRAYRPGLWDVLFVILSVLLLCFV
ncbi:hypothetical protein ACF0H5_017672 [Mactra antiquata]